MIEVRIQRDDVIRARSDDVATGLVLRKLREAGIPVLGRLTYQGVEHGTLTYFTDLPTDAMVYQWRPDPVRWGLDNQGRDHDVPLPPVPRYMRWLVGAMLFAACVSAAYAVCG